MKIDRVITTFILSLVMAGSIMADSIKVIDLKNRPAAELIPIIKPMLDPDSTVSGQGFKLIIRGSDQNIEQIQQLISQLDTEAKQLLISVFQGNDRDLQAMGVSAGARYNNGNTSVQIGNTASPGAGSSVRYGTGDSSAQGNAYQTHGNLKDSPIYTLRVSDGNPGHIQTGKSIPVYSAGVWTGRWRGAGAAAGNTEYKDVQSGFYVLPRTHGDQITMEINPEKEALSRTGDQVIKKQNASTIVTGKLGEWIQIGGVNTQAQRNTRSTGMSVSTQSQDNASIWIKAEVVQ